eukprot:g12697.t1
MFGLTQGWVRGEVVSIDFAGKACVVSLEGDFLEPMAYLSSFDTGEAWKKSSSTYEYPPYCFRRGHEASRSGWGTIRDYRAEWKDVRVVDDPLTATNSSNSNWNSNEQNVVCSVLMVRWWDYWTNRRCSDYKIDSEFAIRSLIEDCGLKKLFGKRVEIYSLFVRDSRELEQLLVVKEPSKSRSKWGNKMNTPASSSNSGASSTWGTPTPMKNCDDHARNSAPSSTSTSKHQQLHGSLLDKMLGSMSGQHKVGMYFLWPCERTRIDPKLHPAMIAERTFFSFMEQCEAKGVASRYPCPARLYRKLCGKEYYEGVGGTDWVLNSYASSEAGHEGGDETARAYSTAASPNPAAAETSSTSGKAVRVKVPATTRVFFHDVARNPLAAARGAITSLGRIKGGGTKNKKNVLPPRSGVVKLPFSWCGADVMKWDGEEDLARKLVAIFSEPNDRTRTATTGADLLTQPIDFSQHRVAVQTSCLVQELVFDRLGEVRVVAFACNLKSGYDLRTRYMPLRGSSCAPGAAPRTAGAPAASDAVEGECRQPPDTPRNAFDLTGARALSQQQAVTEMFGGDETACAWVDQRVKDLASAFLSTWYAAHWSQFGAGCPAFARFDFLLSSDGGVGEAEGEGDRHGSLQLWLCELSELGVSLCSLPVEARNTAVANSCLLDFEWNEKTMAEMKIEPLPWVWDVKNDELPEKNGWILWEAQTVGAHAGEEVQGERTDVATTGCRGLATPEGRQLSKRIALDYGPQILLTSPIWIWAVILLRR